ncbi:DUF4321 domain-containing protein [Anaeromicropila herbilytica]|uniref:DUF4321 domain-containing protein n=1 Tax=Anaeromicropila herbilytica TaxID=2785025 RepID=A0A7R7EM00_9FIRM|nr:DUF4321 domain-containing protein [Anaeromicropila herbilytica]BCN31213.1 hypothetical protein bsdtb5_25080 [Anaeromicropila herbilytica]
MAKTSDKNFWILFLLMLSGIVLGGFVGYAVRGMQYFTWLNYGQEFGFKNPIILNLGIMTITFGLKIKITLASILGVVISIFVYKKI